MPNVTYITHDGNPITIAGKLGASVMETAVRNGVPGIVAECGGSCMCATCHVYVESDPGGIAAVRNEAEEVMLEEAIDEVKSNSRLSCQIRLVEAAEGLVARIARNE